MWSFLATLNHFLSFARGVSCGIAPIKGLDEAGETIWEEWGVTKVQPWKRFSSCLDRHKGASLEDLFAAFCRFCQGRRKNSRALLALEWYLESNAQEALHTSIVLNQAALERLAFEMVGPRKVAQSCMKSRKEKEGAWIARALCNVNADYGIPAPFKEAMGTERFAHGPHALVAIRNDLVHEEMKHDILTFEAYRQARELGLWYVELLLLALFGYRGLYSNRLTGEWTGDVERVPWASPS